MSDKDLGLLAEDIVVQVVNVQYQFGFEVGVYEGDYNPVLRLREQKYATFLVEESARTYPI